MLSKDYVHHGDGEWVADADDTVIVGVADPEALAISLGCETEYSPSQGDAVFGAQHGEGDFALPDRVNGNGEFSQREFVNIQIFEPLSA